jgi:integrase
VIHVEWPSVDRERGVLRFPNEIEKNGQPREIPLVGPLAEIIERRWHKRALGCSLVFHRCGKRIKNFKDAWRTACTKAGVPDLTFHDLRRSAVRNMELNNVPRSVAMKVSGHRTESIYRRYAITTTDDVRAELERVQAAKKPPAKVIAMR